MGRIHPVILCGGSGTRLWPKSRPTRPKPFIPLIGERTLFREAVERCGDGAIFAPPLIVAGPNHVPLIEEQMASGEDHAIIVEPCARNTAAAIALAAARLEPDAVMLVCPSDHHIADETAFAKAAEEAALLAAQGWLVSFGIAPDRPETGYGYIRRGEPLDTGFKVDAFVEKPDLARAQGFLADGGYAWNGGIFAFRAGSLLDELAAHRPTVAAAIQASVEQGEESGSLFHPDSEAFGKIEGESIDYAVMENTARAAMVPVDMGWSDIGNWAALQDALPQDGEGNHSSGQADLDGCRNVLTMSDGPRISAVGVEDICIVVDGDEVLVTTRDGAQVVGKLPGASAKT